MTAVIQRVTRAEVRVENEVCGSCGAGLFILLGVSGEDTREDAELLAAKIAKLRIFCDAEGKMNRSVLDTDGEALVVSNFTLLANYRHGNRPDFFGAAAPEAAKELYDYFSELLGSQLRHVGTGIFGADMKIAAECDGPVTIVMESDVLKKGKAK